MNAQPTQLYPDRRRRQRFARSRYAVWAMFIYFAFTLLSNALHQRDPNHAYCPEHRVWEHNHSHDHDLPEHDHYRGEDEEFRRFEFTSHDHEACQQCSTNRYAFLQQPLALNGARSTAGQQSPVINHAVSSPVYMYAPMLSPPVLTPTLATL